MTSTSDTEQTIRRRIKRKLCTHDWLHNWADREKVCHECGETQPIKKEYTHEDESAEIGGTRLRVRKSRKQFKVEREQYLNTAHGPDDAYFQWFPAGGFNATESDLLELREQIDCTIDADTSQEGSQ